MKPLLLSFLYCSCVCCTALAQSQPEPQKTVAIWPDLAPGETSRDRGTAEPVRPNENPKVTRLRGIRQPTLNCFPAETPNGTGVLVLPGGGFAKVVPDKEGSEIAQALNQQGISVFVLNYRTNEELAEGEPAWKRPAQDAQRALRWLRANAEEYQLDPARIGLVAFSAGGQVGAIVHTAQSSYYDPLDAIDEQSLASDFSLLIYPWRILDPAGKLLPEIQVTPDSKPVFIVHTHDDASSSVGAALLYIDFKEAGASAEIHVYQNGGHGYGVRPKSNSVIHTWFDRAQEWLWVRELGRK